ncbi:MAG TPA: 2-amino-4-hydroxy-6-hydroxymethyldihydropteridine diphosphokinase [Salinimicrobium sp.]|nr:2-amino-4-hydroxy-6-hydroxymethyldihydropteridine diphosphokinase [Salinimicrobium sp.]
MIPPKKAYLSLGSNIDDRVAHLENAIQFLFENVGDINQISKVYSTPSWGFDGADFYNICLEVTTRLNPQQLLEKLLEIELKMGRSRSNEKGYKNRNIDIDVLFFEDEKIESEALVIPHPFLHERKFVLQPLSDIAGEKKHPILDLSVKQLLSSVKDNSEIQTIDIQLKKPQLKNPFHGYNYIAIEGNIGAGKTSLSHMISQDFNARLILERFKDNPFLPKFYEDQARYAFPLEMSFLADRYQQLSDDLAQYDLFADFIVSDYDIFKSLIFAKITLQEDEYLLYYKLFNFMFKELKKPDLYIYLYQNTERLLSNIKKRGREYEKEINKEYLTKINSGYLSFIKAQQGLNVRIIDISDMDFVENRKDYLSIISEI